MTMPDDAKPKRKSAVAKQGDQVHNELTLSGSLATLPCNQGTADQQKRSIQ